MEGGENTRQLRPQTAVIEEWHGTSSSKLTKTATVTVSGNSVRKSARRFSHLSRRILDAFVPEGFPGSVTPDYVPFQIWDSLQGLSTYIRTMLSTQALLSAIGVGEKSATVIGATFQWFLRDLTGMLGGVLFTFYQVFFSAPRISVHLVLNFSGLNPINRLLLCLHISFHDMPTIKLLPFSGIKPG
ncbi:Protein root UVB sensitive 3 [Striga hermonthica]|uniref:Protein root UVB sensitive 3 n=1 Tax=Striga hermonthica TaxID=68872 RepID=A0A9N7REB6_STRHE|nr:Protein root UVB sensitive 3 [Striga hermonthica]